LLLAFSGGSFAQDTDGDGVVNATDLDDDNDGLLDTDEDDNLDLDANPYTNQTDNDNDGFADASDCDADGDALFDVIEAGGTDADQNGIIDGFIDADVDGWDDATEVTPLANADTEADGKPNFQDIDSDGDGIIDNIEGQGSYAYLPPLGYDTDADGIDDGYDLDNGGTPPVIPDMDQDNRKDYLDQDTDNDNEDDIIEGWDTNGDGSPDTSPAFLDTDSDGLDNNFDSDGASPIDNGGAANNGSLPTDFPDEDLMGIGDLDWREYDTDKDGIGNLQDEDDDNDGIPDYVEVCGSYTTAFDCVSDPMLDDDDDGIINFRDFHFGSFNSQLVCAFLDHDSDGVIDIFDHDSDNDGISDLDETGKPDVNDDGKVDDMYIDGTLKFDSDGDGFSDSTQSYAPRDCDSLGSYDFRDLDADNDGMYDIIENGGLDVNDDGKSDAVFPDSTLADDPDGDGWTNSTNAHTTLDTDNDGYADISDADSDNDGIQDILEIGTTDINYDGKIDAFNDANGDGADDFLMVPGTMDSDSDTIYNRHDLDSDDDLISDSEEGGAYDGDNDGLFTLATDVNADGWADGVVTALSDTDADGSPDFRDRDSDADQIWDIVEAGKLLNDTDLNGAVDGYTDANNDGWHDGDHVGSGNVPNTDASGSPDYQDVDSDGDETMDIDEWDIDNDNIGPDDCNGDGIYDWIDPAFCDIFVPEGFSPNGDGFNDYLVLTGMSFYANSVLVIYNRWGEKVFESINYQNDWDGTHMFSKTGDVQLPTGTYFYVFEPERNDVSGNPVAHSKGFVYLSR